MLYFTANDGIHGAELWRSDGSEAGTVLVKDINPNPESWWGPDSVVCVNGTLFFGADDGIHGYELWKSDGTEAGTVLVADIDRIGAGSVGWSNALLDVNGTLYFTADDGSHGLELWKSDGTPEETNLVRDINPGWMRDGPASSSPDNLTNVDGMLYFTADDGVHGRELWKTDGTQAGTELVKDINLGPNGSWPSGSNLVALNDVLYFVAGDGTNGQALWRTDGTKGETTIVKEVTASPRGAKLTRVGQTLYFTAGSLPVPRNSG